LIVDGVASITGKGGRTRVVRLSRGTWDELAALRTAETIGEDFVFPMSPAETPTPSRGLLKIENERRGFVSVAK
jgi:hypothetical protein